MNEPKLVMVYNAGSEFEAQVIKGRLASSGIPAMIKNEGLTLLGTVGEFQVLVPEGWEREAHAVLARKSTGDLEL